MPKCIYLYNGKQYKSYTELINEIINNGATATDILFSLDDADIQGAVYDRIVAFKKSAKLDHQNMHMIDGSPDLESDKEHFTTQTFIDSEYFKDVEGNPFMFRLNPDDYIARVVEQQIKAGKSEEEMKTWASTIKSKWKDIAENATVFHKLIMGHDNQSSYEEWVKATKDTAFDEATQQVIDAEGAIWKEVMKNHGRKADKTGGSKVIKNLNFESELKGMTEKILGHIDYLVVKENGEIELYNVKTSTEPFNTWSAAKMQKYKYQLALLKQMLANHGISTNYIVMHIIPVQIKYDEDFKGIESINVEQEKNVTYNGTQYTFDKYDRAAKQFIESNINTEAVRSSDLVKVSEQLKHIFPGKNVMAEGMMMTAEEWIDANWKHFYYNKTEDGKMEITIPQTQETFTLSDVRKGSHNAELVKLIQARIGKIIDASSGNQSAHFIRTALQEAYGKDFFALNIKGPDATYLQGQFSKYYEKDSDGNYKWKLIEIPALDEANIIMFKNKEGQIDVFTITGISPDIKYQFKRRDNLLGFYLPDSNNLGFQMKSTYGNINAIRTMALINQIVESKALGDITLGNLQVIGLGGGSSKKAVSYEFDQLLPVWQQIISVVNSNTPANIQNNFRKNNIKCVSAEEVVYQTWKDILNNQMVSDMTEIKNLGEIFEGKKDAGGLTTDGLMTVETVEQKMQKLRQLVDRLTSIAESNNIDISNPQALADLVQGKGSPRNIIIAKLYIEATQALSKYYGDVSMTNEQFSVMQEYFMKTTSINNSNVRRVGYLLQKSIDNVRARVLDRFFDDVMPVFKQFYADAGFTSVEGKVIGDQARLYNNLYQLADDGSNTFLLKNPYEQEGNTNYLKDYERRFLKNILYQFYRVKCDMRHKPCNITGPDDSKLRTEMPTDYLFVPLQRASSATHRMNALNGGLKKQIIDWVKTTARFAQHPKEVIDEVAGFISKGDVENRDKAIAGMRTYNKYTRSETSLPERDLMIDEKGESYFETNLENIFVDFLQEDVKCDEFNKLLMRVKAIETGLILKGVAEGDTTGVNHTIKTIDDFINQNVYGKSIMTPETQAIDTYLRPLKKMVTALYIPANPAGAVRDTLQGLQENFLMAAIKFQTDINASDVAFAYGMVFKDSMKNLDSMTMFNQFNVKYGFSNFDAARVAERLKSSRYGILNGENWLYWTLRAPDYLNRMTLFIAKLHHDGAYDAYSLDSKTKRIKYDWRKDKRFSVYASGDTSNPEYKKQQSLYFSKIRAFNIENGTDLAYTDDLPDAYTPTEIRAIKTISESIYGAYDDSSKAKYEQTAIGRNFCFYSTWMNGITDNYFKGRQISQSELVTMQETDYNGQPLFFLPNGNTTTEDTGVPVMKTCPIMVQGIKQTLAESLKEFVNGVDDDGLSGGWKNFKNTVWANERNRANYRRLLTDLLVMIFFSALFKMFLDPAYKDHKKNDDGKDMLANIGVELIYKGAGSSYDTFKGPLNIVEYLGNSTNPATYKVQSKILNDSYNLFFGDKTLKQTISGSQAFFRSMKDSWVMYERDTKSAS